MKKYVMTMAKAMAVSYVITAVMLFILSALLYRFDISQDQLQIGLIFTYIISTFWGGFYVGKRIKKRDFLWGMIVGLLYYTVHVSVIIALEGCRPSETVPATALVLLCMGCGMLGGMLG